MFEIIFDAFYEDEAILGRAIARKGLFNASLPV
jgi:hypothetical protein